MAEDLRRGIRIARYDPETHDGPEVHHYQVTVSGDMTLLDVLVDVEENVDPSLSFRYSCRGGICGACGVQANGMPVLACRTRISGIETNDGQIEIAPLANHPVIRDLVADLDPMLNRIASIDPWTQPDDGSPGSGMDSDMLQYEVERLGRSETCIACGLCDAAAPAASPFSDFLGPAALVRIYRHAADVRDGSDRQRLELVTGEGGIWDREPAEEWNVACPLEIEPANRVESLRAAAEANQIGKPGRRVSGAEV